MVVCYFFWTLIEMGCGDGLGIGIVGWCGRSWWCWRCWLLEFMRYRTGLEWDSRDDISRIRLIGVGWDFLVAFVVSIRVKLNRV